MKKTVLVTGCNGFIGSTFVRLANEKYHIIGLDITKSLPSAANCESIIQADICDYDAMQRIFEQYEIDVVVHTAAEKSLIVCQSEQSRAYRMNYLATKHLHELTCAHGAKFIFISSDQVFDGTVGYYSENAKVSAINYYGELKIEVEKLLGRDPLSAICRTALVFGEIPEAQKPYFDMVKKQNELAVQGFIVQQTKYRLENGLDIILPDDEYVSPTHVNLLAKQIDTVIQNSISGILHCCGKGRISRYEMGLQIAEYYDLNSEFIRKNGPENKLRPKDVSLDCTLTESLLGFHFPTFSECLKEYM